MSNMTKREVLEAELKKVKGKLQEIVKQAVETKGGSRYGDEYLEVQIKVYSQMISELQEELKRTVRG